MTAPTCFRGQVDRVDTCRAMFMKYVCQSTRSDTRRIMPEEPGRRPGASNVSESIIPMNRGRGVVVTGLGAVTAIGRRVEEFWRNLTDGVCGIRPISLFDASAYRTQTAAEVSEIPD